VRHGMSFNKPFAVVYWKAGSTIARLLSFSFYGLLALIAYIALQPVLSGTEGDLAETVYGVAEQLWINLPLVTLVLGVAAVGSILSHEAARARRLLVNSIYGEVALYGSISLQDLLEEYGFREVSALEEIFREIEKTYRVRMAVDGASGLVHIVPNEG
jgi:hypothetical protein